MIQNEHQKQVTLGKIKDLQLALLVPKRQEVSAILHKAYQASLWSLIKELELEVKEFDERNKVK